MNLLKETKRDLMENGKTISDIRWVGTNEVQIPVDVFLALANKEYDNGYGSQHVASDLVVVGDDWWMERREYDGSEWWEFKRSIREPKRTVIPRAVVDESATRMTLKEMNHPGGKYSAEPWDWDDEQDGGK